MDQLLLHGFLGYSVQRDVIRAYKYVQKLDTRAAKKDPLFESNRQPNQKPEAIMPYSFYDKLCRS